MKIRKPFVTWDEFEGAIGGDWSPAVHTHVKADITDTPWAWADILTAGSNLTDLATRQHAGLTNVTSDQHHAQDHAAEHEVAGGDLLTFANITGFGTYIDQALLEASSPTFVTAKLTALTDGYVPYHVSDVAGLANSPIFIVGANTIINVGSWLDARSAGATDVRIQAITGAAGADARLFLGEETTYGMTFEYDGAANIGYIGMNDDVLPTGAWSKRIQMSRTGTEVAFMAGNVGINVADPDEKLEVNGNIKADTFLLAAGVTPNLGWLSDVVLGELEEGETIMYDQATEKWIDAWGVEYDNPRLVWKMYSDFFSTANDANDPWVGAIFGGGGKSALTGTSNHPGIVRLSSNGVGGSRFMTATNCIRIAGAEHSEFCFKTGTIILGAYARLGFQDSLTATLPTDGIWIDINTGTLTGKTRNNGAESTTGTNYALAVNTWYRAKIAVNSDATLITYILYSVAGVVLWTNTLAANIPTAAGRETGHGVVMYVATGIARTFDVDMMIATRAGYITR